MNFREEYKKSAESLSPDREAIDRMKAAVMAKIAEEQQGPAEQAEKKKPVPFRKIAYIGGAAAACAAVTIAAVAIIPSMSHSSGLVMTSSTSSAAMENAEIANDADYDEVAGSMLTENSCNSADQILPGTAGCETDEIDDAMAGASDILTDNGISENGMGFAPMPENSQSDPEMKPDGSLGNSFEQPSGSIDKSTDKGHDFAPAEDIPENAEISTDEVCGTEECGVVIAEETCDAGTYEYSEECTEEANMPTDVITITDKGNVTYGGITYCPDGSIKSASCPTDAVSVLNSADQKPYLLSLRNGTLYLFSESGKFLGAYRSQ